MSGLVGVPTSNLKEPVATSPATCQGSTIRLHQEVRDFNEGTVLRLRSMTARWSIASAAASRRSLVLHAAGAVLPPAVCPAGADLIPVGLLKELAATAVGTSNRALSQ